MQNDIRSSLLSDYIKNYKSSENRDERNLFVKNTNIQSPKLNILEKDVVDINKPKSEKHEKSKTALVATLGLSTVVAGGMLIRHRSGVSDFIKKTYEGIKNSKAGEEIKEFADSVSSGGKNIQIASDNIINSKDTLARKLLSHIPGYSKFDDALSNLYRRITKGVITQGWEKASKEIQEADGAIIEALKKAGHDENSPVIKLLQKRMQDVKTFAEGAERRYQQLDESLKGIHEEGYQKLKQMVTDRNGKKFFTENIGQERLDSAKKGFEKLLEGHEYGGLTKDEVLRLERELEGLFKENPELKSQAERAMRMFQKAYATESVSLFPKLRDINFGSAPTDAITLITAAGGLGVYASQAETKEEKIGVTLTTGIPLLATLGTTTIATSKMVSGGKSLTLGLIMGWIANAAGKKANEQYQKTTNKKYEQTIATLDDVTDKIKKDIGIKNIIG